MPACPRCGAQQAERTAFCSACGALIDRPDTATAPVEPDRTIPAAPIPPILQGSPLPTASASVQQGRPLPAEHDFGDVGVYIMRRFLALVVDLAGVGFLIGIGLIALVDGTQAQPDQYLALHLRDFAIALGGSILLYLTLSEALFGSTVGKGLFGLGVCRMNGARLGLGRALVRNLVLPVDLAAIGFLVATVTKRRRRIGDFLAGSVVANARLGRVSTLAAAVVGVAAAWGLFAVVDGARMSSQLLALAALRMPVELGRPVPAPSIGPVVRPSATPSVSPSPTHPI